MYSNRKNYLLNEFEGQFSYIRQIHLLSLSLSVFNPLLRSLFILCAIHWYKLIEIQFFITPVGRFQFFFLVQFFIWFRHIIHIIYKSNDSFELPQFFIFFVAIWLFYLHFFVYDVFDSFLCFFFFLLLIEFVHILSSLGALFWIRIQ